MSNYEGQWFHSVHYNYTSLMSEKKFLMKYGNIY